MAYGVPLVQRHRGKLAATTGGAGGNGTGNNGTNPTTNTPDAWAEFLNRGDRGTGSTDRLTDATQNNMEARNTHKTICQQR